jgi:hypothetical protein
LQLTLALPLNSPFVPFVSFVVPLR